MVLGPWTILGGLIGFALLVIAFISVAVDGTWEQHIQPLLIGFGGLVAFVFSETFAEFTGHYGLTRE